MALALFPEREKEKKRKKGKGKREKGKVHYAVYGVESHDIMEGLSVVTTQTP